MSALISRATAQRYLAVTLGGLLLTSSLLNLWAETRYQHAPMHPWLENRITGPLVSIIECLLGAVLVAGGWRRLAWYAALSLFIGFVLITAGETIRRKESCSCFGAFQVRPAYTMSLDIAAVAALLISGRPMNETAVSRSRGHVAFIFAMGAFWLSAFVIVWQTRPIIAPNSNSKLGEAGTLVLLQPERWSGQNFSLAEHIDVGVQFGRGQWIVLLVHHDCDHCIATVSRYVLASSTTSGMKPRLAVIEMPPFGDPTETPSWQLPQFVLSGKLDPTHGWLATPPIALRIKDGIVISEKGPPSAETPDLAWWKP